MTLLIAVLFILLFPQSPKRPVSLAGLRHFSQRESEILAARVLTTIRRKQTPGLVSAAKSSRQRHDTAQVIVFVRLR